MTPLVCWTSKGSSEESRFQAAVGKILIGFMDRESRRRARARETEKQIERQRQSERERQRQREREQTERERVLVQKDKSNVSKYVSARLLV
jgi:hypothetical protein